MLLLMMTVVVVVGGCSGCDSDGNLCTWNAVVTHTMRRFDFDSTAVRLLIKGQ